jgi:hypothetical protein
MQINETIALALQDSGVSVYMGSKIVDVKFGNSGVIQSVELDVQRSGRSALEELESDGGETKQSHRTGAQESRKTSAVSLSGNGNAVLLCNALLCCGQKQCEADVFAAINDSGLIYDGGVVVNEVSINRYL